MPATLRYFLYARKSTDVEDKQVRSIEGQLSELRELVSRCSLNVVEEFIEKKSAKAPGREVFVEMINRIEAGDANAILAWHPDRLARNPVDGGQILHLLDTGKLHRLQFHGSSIENTPQGKMMLGIEFGFSKYYVDELSENVKRGHRTKVERGEWPGCAPFGYVNDSRSKLIKPDPDRARFVREIFELYAGGDQTLDSIGAALAVRGLTAASGAPVTRNLVSKILSNPIYYGHFQWGGELHEGVHEPLIDKALFDKVQTVLRRRFRHSKTQPERLSKPYAGLLSCGECGCSITAEIQKGHTYYRCSKKRKGRRCSQRYVREETLDRQISWLLLDYASTPKRADELTQLLADDETASDGRLAELLVKKETALAKFAVRLDRIKTALYDGDIGSQDFRSDKAKILGEKKIVEEDIAKLQEADRYWLEPLRDWVSTAKDIGEIASATSLSAKKALAEKLFGSNLLLTSKRARGKAANPWALLAVNELQSSTAHLYDAARTFFQENRR